MITQTAGQLYLADQRGVSQLPWFRSFHSFNFGNYFDESRKPFGNLQILNDDTLAAGKSMKMQLEDDTEIIILPLIGGVEFKTSKHDHEFLSAGQALVFSASKGMEYEVINPYETELINFLQIWVKKASIISPKVEIIDVDTSQKNQLLPVSNTCYLGVYAGRAEELYRLKNTKNGVFAFVIEGAFEVQNRLLHARDGVALWNLEELDFEALSNEAIILLMEIENN